ncbi:MAG: DNA translocase FtsK, partial [Planctomycetaceae bacterium]
TASPVAADPSASPATGLAQLAGGVAAAAASALGIAKKSDVADAAADADAHAGADENIEDDAGDSATADATTENPGIVREISLEGEDLTLRGDEPHEGPAFKIKVPKKRDELQAVFDAVREDLPESVDEYRLPSLELLDESDDICFEDQTVEVRRKAKILEQTFKNFGFNIRVVEIETGPVIAQYEVELEAGLRLSKITGLADDLAIALRVPSVRIVAPIPGKNTVGIEVPNEQRQVVRLREVIEECDSSARKMNIPVFLGKDVSGNPLTVDLAKMPHLLIAGRTGTGKSVCLNAIITSILMTCRPDDVRMLMIDPKMVELSGYARLPHLMHPVVTDMKKAEAILAWAVEKMEERYALLAKAGVRHINSYNDLGKDELYRRLEVDESDGASGIPEKLPFIVIIADEMADLMMTAGKEVETHIIRLAQKSRAVGIHLILATQKPTVDVITGLIKSNLPARLSFQVASKTDSRVVLDENGADKLLGNGDMLFLWPGTSVIMRGQGTYLSDSEIDRVVEHCSTGEQNFVGELMNLKIEDSDAEPAPVVAGGLKKRDELYESAIEIVVREGRGSVSLLQRCLGIGYGRAARLIDYMAEDGLVGVYNGSQAREVTITMADWERMQGLESTASSVGSDAFDPAED